MNIIYLNCGKYELDGKKIITLIDTTFAVVKISLKKSGLYGIEHIKIYPTFIRNDKSYSAIIIIMNRVFFFSFLKYLNHFNLKTIQDATDAPTKKEAVKEADCGSSSVQHLVHFKFTDYVTADCGSTSVEHLDNFKFKDYGTADRGSSSVHRLVNFKFTDHGTADCGSSSVQHLNT